MMERYFDVIKRTISLSDSCQEGIRFMLEQPDESYYEKTVTVLESVIRSVYQMNESLQPILPLLQANHLDERTTTLVGVVGRLADAYRDQTPAMRPLQDKLANVYGEWKEELEACLYPPYLMALGKASTNEGSTVLH